MDATSLHKQANEPLYPKVFWDKPINRRAAKKLLILGGHAKRFDEAQLAYQAAIATGIGEAKVVLPESVRTTVGNQPDCLYVAETKSGSLAKAAFADIQGFANDADGLLFAGQLSNNPETISLLEQILTELEIPMVLSADTIETMLYHPAALVSKKNRLLLAPTQLLVKLAGKLDIALTISSEPSLVNKASLLETIGAQIGTSIILLGHDLMVYSSGKVSTTPVENFSADLFGLARGVIATFWLQQEKDFEGLTTAAFVLSQISKLKDQGAAISLKNLQNILAEYSQ